MTGWQSDNASVQAIMQLLGGNPQMYGAELSRQLAAGAGPFNIQAAQVILLRHNFNTNIPAPEG